MRRAASGALVHPSTPLDEVCADWIVAIKPELGAGTDRTYEVYAGHWVAHFETIGGVTTARIGDYQRRRLGSVQRTTVVKERSALLRFLTWCMEQEVLRDVPDFPRLPKKASGKRHKQARRKPSVELAPAEADAILAALPEWSRTREGERFPIRARFEFAYETGLRPATLDKLVGRDVSVGGLHIRPEVDKNRWERVVPLTARARDALKRLGPVGRAEPLFGEHDYRAPFRAACVAALGDERGKLVTPYDLKHGRVTHLLDAGAPVMGIRYLTGTNVALDRYAHPTRRAAEAAIGGHMGDHVLPTECEGRDLNPDESYLASTSSKLDATDTADLTPGEPSKPASFRTDDRLSGDRPPMPALCRIRCWERGQSSTSRPAARRAS